MYEIGWQNEALRQLAIIILATRNPNLVTLLDGMLRELEVTPLSTGLARESSVHRMSMYDPLTLDYEVIEDDKKVVILNIYID
jgi:hypothetical protein